MCWFHQLQPVVLPHPWSQCFPCQLLLIFQTLVLPVELAKLGQQTSQIWQAAHQWSAGFLHISTNQHANLYQGQARQATQNRSLKVAFYLLSNSDLLMHTEMPSPAAGKVCTSHLVTSDLTYSFCAASAPFSLVFKEVSARSALSWSTSSGTASPATGCPTYCNNI